MPDPSTSIAATQGGFDLAALTRPIFAPKVPYSEWAGRVRYGAELDTARIDNTLRAADMGVMWPLADLARETIAYNPKAQGLITKAFIPIGAADWDLTPAEGDGLDPEEAKRVATKIRSMLQAIPRFRQAVLDLAFAFFDGRAGLELQATRRPTGTGIEWWPSALDWIQPQRLSFEESRRLIIVDRWGDYGSFARRGPVLDEVPGKFITSTPRVFGDLQEREGLAPRFLFWLLFDRVNWRQRFIVAERFGVPWLMIEQLVAEAMGAMKLPRVDGGEGGAPHDDGKALDYAVVEARNLKQDGIWVGLPGQKLTASWPPDSVREFFSQGSDQIIDRLAFMTLHTSSTSTSNETGTRAGDVVQRSDQDKLLDFRGSMVSEAIQTGLVDKLVELNMGASALPYSPKFQIRTSPPRDRGAEVDRVLKVAAVVPVGVGVLYEASATRPPNASEDVIQTIALTPSDVGAVTRVDEARVKSGLDPVGGDVGQKWVIEHSSTFSAFGTAKGEEVGARAANTNGASLPAKARDEGASDASTGALQDLLEGADEDDQNEAADKEAGAAMSRWFAAEGRKVQPRSANGTPETIVERGVREGARYTSRWADELLDVADGNDAARVYRNLSRAGAAIDLEPMARAFERRIVHSLMLGGLDADHEMTSEVVIAPASFAFDAAGVGDFALRPFGEAIRAFLSRKVVTRRTFDRMLASAKKKAFTVAGLARKDMVAVAHDELGKAITAGADLKTFSKALSERFDSAGWTKLNPSHVETVFRNGVMGAYSDGRKAQMTQPLVLQMRPYWQILGVDDARTRPTHKKAHGKVLPANDPFFDRAGPPFGHNCRDRTVSRSAKDLQRLGLTPTIGAALTGLPDPGWSTDGSLL